MPVCAACAVGGAPCPACGGDGGGVLRRQVAAGGDGGSGGEMVAPALVGSALVSPEVPLPIRLRERFERRLGTHLGWVRLHAGDEAVSATLSVQARAFALGPHIALGAAPGSAAGERLLAHEVAHTLQDGDVLRRNPDDPQALDPQIESLRRLLSDGNEAGALSAMAALSAGQVARVLADGGMRGFAVSAFNDEEMMAAIRAMAGQAVPSLRWLFDEGVDFADFRDWLASGPPGVAAVLGSDEMREGFVSACDDAQMAEAVRLLPGLLARRLDWLRAEGTGFTEARQVIEATPAEERPALYADSGLRDWFVDVCDDIWMQNLVMLLGGRLIMKLRWMQAEGASWILLRVVIGDSRVAQGERAEVLDDPAMRRFFQESLSDWEMTQALETLGGTLSQKMEWLEEEGATSVPPEVQHLPEVAPRDAALMDTLDRATPLFTLFEQAEAARATVRQQQALRGAARDPTAVADAMEVSAARLREAEAALATELHRLGYADEAAFRDEIRRFEAFFHGFALQTAFTMLAENRRTAVAQRDRYTGAEGASLVALLRDALLQDVRTMIAIRTSWSRIAPGSLRGAMAEHPILANPAFFTGGMLDMVAANNAAGVGAHIRASIDDVIAKIDEVRTTLSGDSSKLWKSQPVIARAREALGIVQGSAMDGILRRKLAEVDNDETFNNLVIAALAIGLGLLSGGTGTVAVLAGAGALGLSTWQAGEHWQDFAFQQAAHGSAVDPAQALVGVPPSAVWLAIDIAGAFLDARALTTAMRPLTPAAAAVRTASNAAEAATRVRALKQAAVDAMADRTVRSAVRSEGALEDAVRNAAEREVARRASLESAPDLVRRISELDSRLAEDMAAQAGLTRMGGAAAEAALGAFRNEPALLQRLGRLCEMDPAAAAGAQRLRAAMGDDAAFVAILRDGLMRRDPARARSLLAMVGDGHLSEEAMRRLAAAAAETNPIVRATSIAEVAEREAAEATGTALPGSRGAREALEDSRALEPAAITDPATQLRQEWEAVQDNHPLPIRDGDYVAQVTLPNGHRWQQNRSGGWCRFSEKYCLSEADMAELNAARTRTLAAPPVRRTLRSDLATRIDQAIELAPASSPLRDKLLKLRDRLGIATRKLTDRLRTSSVTPDNVSAIEDEFLRRMGDLADDFEVEGNRAVVNALRGGESRPISSADVHGELDDVTEETARSRAIDPRDPAGTAGDPDLPPGTTVPGSREIGRRARAALRRKVGPAPRDWQNHHLIPLELREHEAVYYYDRIVMGVDNPRAIRSIGNRFVDSEANNLPMPGSAEAAGSSGVTIHRSSHPEYTDYVEGRLDALWAERSNLSDVEFARRFEALVGDAEIRLGSGAWGSQMRPPRRPAP